MGPSNSSCMLPELLKLHDAALLLDKSEQTVRRMIKKGEIEAKRMKTPQGFHYLIPSESLKAYASEQRENGLQTELEHDIEGGDFLTSQQPVTTSQNDALISRNETLTNQTENPTSQDQNLTSQNDVSPSQQPVAASQSSGQVNPHEKLMEDAANFQDLTKKHHDEKMALYRILEKLQVELDQERKKPRSLFAYFMDWLLG